MLLRSLDELSCSEYLDFAVEVRVVTVNNDL